MISVFNLWQNLGQLGQDVGLLDDQILVLVGAEDAVGDLLTAVLGIQDAVTNLEVYGNTLAVLIEAARAHSQHFAQIGLLAGCVGDNQSAGPGLTQLDLLD